MTMTKRNLFDELMKGGATQAIRGKNPAKVRIVME